MYLINADELMKLSDHGTIILGYTQLFKIFLNIFDMVVIPETFEFTSYLPVLERKWSMHLTLVIAPAAASAVPNIN